jgi:hypothetical protein
MDIKEPVAQSQEIQINTDVEYQICCSHSSKEFIKFSSAFIISFSIMIFSFVMIGLNPTRDNTIYFSLISAIMTLFVNPPSIQEKKKES